MFAVSGGAGVTCPGSSRDSGGPMKGVKDRHLLTTGQLAALFNVSLRTVTKWIDGGQLKGFRLPGTNDRRVGKQAVVEFAAATGIPLPDPLRPKDVVTFGSPPGEGPPGAVAVPDPISLGVALAQRQVAAAVIGDADGLSLALAACRIVRGLHPGARVALVVDASVDPHGLDRRLFDFFAVRPVDWSAVVVGMFTRRDQRCS